MRRAGAMLYLTPDNGLSDDHSELVPLLPIPNRKVKRLRADDSVDSHAKVGHRQTPYKVRDPAQKAGSLTLWRRDMPKFWQ